MYFQIFPYLQSVKMNMKAIHIIIVGKSLTVANINNIITRGNTIGIYWNKYFKNFRKRKGNIVIILVARRRILEKPDAEMF